MSTKNLRVVVFAESLGPHRGGGELATFLWLRIFKRVFKKVTIVTDKYSYNAISSFALSSNIEVRVLRCLDSSSRLKLLLSLKLCSNIIPKILYGHDVVYVPRLSYPILKYAQKLGIASLIHFHDYIAVDPSGIVVSRNLGVNVSILSVIGVKQYVKRLLSLPVWLGLTQYLNFARAFIFVSKRQYNIICSKNIRLCAGKVLSVLPNPLPYDAENIAKEENSVEDISTFTNERDYVVFAGGLSRLKGYHIVLRIARHLWKKYGIYTVIVGAPFNRLSTANGIIYLKRLPRKLYLKLLKNSILFLHPSLQEEPLPYAIIEAVMLGIPVVATPVGGVPEILGDDYPFYIKRIGDSHVLHMVDLCIKRHSDAVTAVKTIKRRILNSWNDTALHERLKELVEALTMK